MKTWLEQVDIDYSQQNDVEEPLSATLGAARDCEAPAVTQLLKWRLATRQALLATANATSVFYYQWKCLEETPCYKNPLVFQDF